MSAIRETEGKPPVGFIFSRAWFAVARVSEFGAKKYGDPYNYRKGMKWSFMLNAMGRHLIKYACGERVDPETGESHLAHVVWNGLGLLEYEIEGLGEDDLFKGYEKGDHSENAPGS